MKSLAVIFSFFMLITSATPCCTVVDTFGAAGQFEKKDKCDSDAGHNCGDCGQFSSCALCMGFLIPASEPFEVKFQDFIGREKIFPHICNEIRAAENAIWQPPKLISCLN